MNRDLALWLGMAMGSMVEHEPRDGHCEKDGKHCTFLETDFCSCYSVPLEIDSEGHKRCSMCWKTNCMIARKV